MNKEARRVEAKASRVPAQKIKKSNKCVKWQTQCRNKKLTSCRFHRPDFHTLKNGAPGFADRHIPLLVSSGNNCWVITFSYIVAIYFC